MEDTHEGGKYRTHMGAEVKIRRSRIDGHYYAKMSNGPNPKVLSNKIFRTYKDAERAVVRYLKSRERVLHRAVYPDPEDLAR